MATVRKISTYDKLNQQDKGNVLDMLLFETLSKKNDYDIFWQLDLLENCVEFAGDTVFREKIEKQMVALIEVGNEYMSTKSYKAIQRKG